MEDLCSEQYLGGDHWILIWEEELCLEETSMIRGVVWSGDLNVEMPEIGFVRASVDAHNWV